MMLVLEAPTPFDTSIAWRLHNAYWAQRGPAAWQSGEVPFYSTSNSATARQHARLFAALVRDLEAAGTIAPTDLVWVLEPGCGIGLFAANFLAALQSGDPFQRALLARTRYILSDYSEKNLRAVCELERVAPWLASGHVVPALYDLLDPGRVRPLSGGGLTHPLTMVVSNYVCSVIPQQQIQRRQDTWYEMLVETRASSEDPSHDAAAYLAAVTGDATRTNLLRELEFHFSWRPLDLDNLPESLRDPAHLRALARFAEGMPEATFGYPARFFHYLRSVSELLVDGGLVITNDYGAASRQRARGAFDRRPQMYGNSLAQDTNFATFEAWAAEVGWTCLRSQSDLDSVHMALVAPRGVGPHTRAAYAEAYQGVQVIDELLDHAATARLFMQRREFARALRYWLRAASMDENNVEFRYRIGEAAIECGEYDTAITHLLAGHALDPTGWDFDFMLGRSTCLAGQMDESRRWYELSLARDPHPVTHTNLGIVHLHEGREALAWASFNAALALDPQHQRAHERLQLLRDRVWQRAVDGWRAELAAAGIAPPAEPATAPIPAPAPAPASAPAAAPDPTPAEPPPVAKGSAA